MRILVQGFVCLPGGSRAAALAELDRLIVGASSDWNESGSATPARRVSTGVVAVQGAASSGRTALLAFFLAEKLLAEAQEGGEDAPPRVNGSKGLDVQGSAPSSRGAPAAAVAKLAAAAAAELPESPHTTPLSPETPCTPVSPHAPSGEFSRAHSGASRRRSVHSLRRRAESLGSVEDFAGSIVAFFFAQPGQRLADALDFLAAEIAMQAHGKPGLVRERTPESRDNFASAVSAIAPPRPRWPPASAPDARAAPLFRQVKDALGQQHIERVLVVVDGLDDMEVLRCFSCDLGELTQRSDASQRTNTLDASHKTNT